MEIKLASRSNFYATTGMFNPNAGKDAKEKWLADVPLFLGTVVTHLGYVYERVLVEVLATTGLKETPSYFSYPCYMDAITGSLYPLGGGQCLSSDTLQLTPPLAADTEECVKRLRSVSVDNRVFVATA